MRRAPAGAVPIDGRCFAYVFPCRWEDHCKIGFSHDPLGRIAALHPRWYEFFGVELGVVVEAETLRDARDLELELRGPLKPHNAPAPLAVRAAAGGGTEWFRGVEQALGVAVRGLAERGHRVHPLHGWLQAALAARRDGLHEWTLAQWCVGELQGAQAAAAVRRRLRDQLDAFAALEIGIDEALPAPVLAWYRGRS